MHDNNKLNKVVTVGYNRSNWVTYNRVGQLYGLASHVQSQASLRHPWDIVGDSSSFRVPTTTKADGGWGWHPLIFPYRAPPMLKPVLVLLFYYYVLFSALCTFIFIFCKWPWDGGKATKGNIKIEK